ncbi:putative kinesin, partial [Pleomassaria siparia CBS 279.74]
MPPQEQPETPPRPLIKIPFDRDTDFVKRGTTLDKIDRICDTHSTRAALVGLGGVGKSQLAIEYAYRTHERSNKTYVFWVHASNADRFERSYRDIADRVKIAGRQDSQANIFKLVHDWLCDSKDPWLIILDNVDDAQFLLQAQADGQGQPTDSSRTASQPLCGYLPRCKHGFIIVTTRNMDAALKLVERRNIVNVEPMDGAQAQALFKKKLPERRQGDDNHIAELVAELEYMPLAIVQAAAYISERGYRCSVVKYLDEFRGSELKRMSLLKHDKGHLRRDWEAKNSIIVTWQISFEHIRRRWPSAADLLSLMSFFDRQEIPENCLRRHIHSPEEEAEEEEEVVTWQSSTIEDEATEDGFDEDAVVLQNFRLVSVNSDGTVFGMHALVQLATREWLDSNGGLEQWRNQFISKLCASFPKGPYKHEATCQALFAHTKSAAEQSPKAELSLREWATLLYRAAWYANVTRNFPDAIDLALKSMEARLRVLGQEHEDTLCSMSLAGSTYKLRDRWDAAEKLEVQVMETRKKKLGENHPSTLTSMANLASTYRKQGQLGAAEKLAAQVTKTYTEKLGLGHRSTLISMTNLVLIYGDQGSYQAAMVDMRVSWICAIKLRRGYHNPTLSIMIDLALIYW